MQLIVYYKLSSVNGLLGRLSLSRSRDRTRSRHALGRRGETAGSRVRRARPPVTIASVADCARYRHGRMPDEVKMMTPGAPEEMIIDLWSTALTFEKGHRIALHVTSSNAPRFEVNPNTGEAPGSHAMPPRIAVNSLYMDAAHPSALVLPVVYPDRP